MARHLPERYHARMQFQPVRGGYRNDVGTIAAVDFDFDTIDLRMPGGAILTFLLAEVTLVNHDACTCGVAVQEVA